MPYLIEVVLEQIKRLNIVLRS